MHWPVLASHRAAVPSPAPVMAKPPSGEKHAALTSPVCPWRACRHRPVSAHQMRAKSSLDAPTTRQPPGENSPVAAAPSSPATAFPVSAHQSLPSPPEATVRSTEPPGAKAADSTGPLSAAADSCGKQLHRVQPSLSFSCRCQSRTVPSNDAERHLSGDLTRATESPSRMPASESVMWSASICSPKRKWTDDSPSSPSEANSSQRSTASLSLLAVSQALTLTTAASSPLTAWRTWTLTSRAISVSSSSSLDLTCSSSSQLAPAASARSTAWRSSWS
mmetsp:Transcript_66065/g.118962  ORF Transcript_66065/g.118962 Transcript_66065/m.118962 type:complete len:276 (+) Transcript_66065:682-1509(+)